MRRIFFGLVATAMVVALAGMSPAWAQCTDCATCSDEICDPGCDTCFSDPCRGGLVFETEALFFKYHRADGVRVGNRGGGIDDVQFDYEITPRLTLGYVAGNGLGFRTRYWDYDQSSSGASTPPDRISVDTFTIDLELFERFCLNDVWSIEVSGGVRYNEFDEYILDQPQVPLGTRLNAFDGWGGVVGLELTRSVGRLGGVYVRGRGAILAADKLVVNDAPQFGVAQAAILPDSTQGMMELAVGYEYVRCLRSGMLLTARAGYEWQNWYNYSTAYSEAVASALPIGVMDGPSDVGFNGFTLMLGIER